MALPVAARIPLVAGAIGLSLSVLNQFTAGSVEPALERAGVLASILAVVLMLVGLLWTRIAPEPAERAPLQGVERLQLAEGLDPSLQRELAWGSALLLTATPAATLLLVWRGVVLLRRGLQPLEAGDQAFIEGAICERARQSGRAISLVDLRLYPGRAEFEALLPGLPSVVVQPLEDAGVLVLGGWSARCFSRSDLTWLEGWTRRLTGEWAPQLDAAAKAAVDRVAGAPGTG
ncbi:cofactor assembly of complex C subunit B [Synechococcus sp. CBW1004]|jgi:hypothetical protein|uniref:cofactor assembly of complex C subunit B n=1 Tax=Synechococcus sp. CBW1004 TaxID=1353136 RepID=UPI0018CE9930|nr:cofactor assembly of complex C subunit B [Synechococcus sp. CBW1004]QPN64010.1 cofactor assembly of complex C subunit B [Synechococcus sp. CBW1004]